MECKFEASILDRLVREATAKSGRKVSYTIKDDGTVVWNDNIATPGHFDSCDWLVAELRKLEHEKWLQSSDGEWLRLWLAAMQNAMRGADSEVPIVLGLFLYDMAGFVVKIVEVRTVTGGFHVLTTVSQRGEYFFNIPSRSLKLRSN